MPLFQKEMKVLEIGPDSLPSTYQRMADGLWSEWDTLDIDSNPNLTFSKSNEYSFAIPDKSYDIVLSGNVIEHVRKPWIWLPELARVTKPGGLVITINPVSWGYHEAPVDCWRIYPDGMKALCEDSSLEVVFSRWESLETPHFRRYLPGVSRECQGRKKRIVSDILGRFGFPIERSYDTITVGRKSALAEQVAAADAEKPRR